MVKQVVLTVSGLHMRLFGSPSCSTPGGRSRSVSGHHHDNQVVTTYFRVVTGVKRVALIVETSRMDFLILTAEEVLQAITSLDDALFGQPITTILPEPPRATRGTSAETMDPQNFQSREDSATEPVNPPPSTQYKGSDYLDPLCVALGLDSRAELRRLQDYLADIDQSVHPVRS